MTAVDTAVARAYPMTSTRRFVEPRLTEKRIVPSLATGAIALPKYVPVDRGVNTGTAVEVMLPCTVIVGVSALAEVAVTRTATAATPNAGTPPRPATRTTTSR